MTDTPIKEIAMGFEAVKVSMSQDKNGIILRLNVHPNDCPNELHTDWVGTRYMVAMVRITDDDKPDDRGHAEIQRLISSAGLLCRNEDFFAFLVSYGMASHTTVQSEMEQQCVDAVRSVCGVSSRSEFKTNDEARKKFISLRERFALWKRGVADDRSGYD